MTDDEEKVADIPYLFPKSYKCPVCDNAFKSMVVKTSKLRLLGTDRDLRPRYNGIEPLKYEPVVCPKCGYSGMNRYFSEMVPIQRTRAKNYEPDPMVLMLMTELDANTFDRAMERYEMVMKYDIICDFDASRVAYTHLKLAWMIRSKAEKNADMLSPEAKESIRKEEEGHLEKALEGFAKAFSTEYFPIAGMDEPTLSLLCAQMSYRLGKYKEALTYLAGTMGKDVNPRIKDKAYDLKEDIRQAIKKMEQEEQENAEA